MFENVNLERKLFKLRSVAKNNPLEHTLERFKILFQAEWEYDIRIRRNLDTDISNTFLKTEKALNSDRIYDLQTIEKLCVQYRLRFLPTRYFRPNFPLDAIRAIKDLENKLETEIKSFYVVAPGSLFKLEDANKDPLLFCPLPDGRFYLIHKWGKDLKWYRKLIAWPFQNFSNLVITILSFSLLLTALSPTSLVSLSLNYLSLGRFLFLGLSVLSSSAIISYLWFTTHQQFSSDCWQKKTFN